MTYTPGQTVYVFKYGGHYGGIVTKVGRTRVFVKFTTKGGKTKEQAFPQVGYGAPEKR